MIELINGEYYWIRFVNDVSKEPMIARYSVDDDKYPWSVFETDNVFESNKIIVIARIQKPNET